SLQRDPACASRIHLPMSDKSSAARRCAVFPQEETRAKFCGYSAGDPRAEIFRLKTEIEGLTEVIERCRKIILISKIAAAAGDIWLLAVAFGSEIDQRAVTEKLMKSSAVMLCRRCSRGEDLAR